ncbi:MAG TPA: Rrf2 family transcriptional regulator [Candidatus Marinimicrobia bacterium]|jgi:Rrf2 family protein|nr:Rrf2 family transcriptional regulator [Candidatus Neomarinimicrobiota bacterium]|tara:strand:+ start:96 stop:539 length:444 start_codon:yes stop_codon:yes gene_type:complete
MLYSKSAEYAIQAMIYLAETKSDKPVVTSKIAKDYNISHQFLAKIVQTLAKNRLIKTTRGRTGGISLYREAKDIYIHQIVDAIDGPPPEQEQCAIGLDFCSDDVPCPLHHQWKPIRESIRQMLSSENLEELADRVIAKRELMPSNSL